MFVIALLVIVGVSACSLVPGDASTRDTDPVTVAKTADDLVIRNHSEATIWTFVAGRQALTTMLWAPSVDGEGIAPGEADSVAIADIPKGPAEQEVVVHWWHAVVQEGERVPGAVQSIVVAL